MLARRVLYDTGLLEHPKLQRPDGYRWVVSMDHTRDGGSVFTCWSVAPFSAAVATATFAALVVVVVVASAAVVRHHQK